MFEHLEISDIIDIPIFRFCKYTQHVGNAWYNGIQPVVVVDSF